MWLNNILETIGNTPLVKLNRVVADIDATILAKVESFNPGNSIKDRMALKMVEAAEQSGALKPGGTIVEGTSGNTGMGLALAGIVKGYKCVFVTTDKQSKEKVDILKAVGAEVIVCPTNVEPEDPRSYYSVSRRLSTEIPGAVYMNQYDNLANREAHYESTGPEIWKQTEGKITHLVVGTGTGGTLSGAGKYLKEQNPDIQLWAADTFGSALKKYHETGIFDKAEIYPYVTEGIGEDILPANIDFQLIDHFEKVTDKDGLLLARKITKEEGILVGNSAGSALGVVLQLKHLLKPTDVVVVVFHDHASRYVAKMYNDDWMRERGFLDDSLSVGDLVRQKSSSKAHAELVTIQSTATIQEGIQLMKHRNISQIPVMNGHEIVGSVNENQVLSHLCDNPQSREEPISSIMGAPFPEVASTLDIKKLPAYLKEETSAVLTRDSLGQAHIITKFDLVQALS